MEKLRFGLILFPEWEVLDVFGPIEALNTMIHQEVAGFSLSILSTSLDPVPSMKKGSPFQQAVVPTHTFDNAPELDMVLIPGGFGAFDLKGTQPHVDFLRSHFPSLKWVFTICNGAGIAARAGVLDGRKATTNKDLWKETVALGKKTHWIANARWIADGNIWTTAGVSAGIDGIVAWIAEMFGDERAQLVCNYMEYRRKRDSLDDEFAVLNGSKDVLPLE